MDKEYIAGMSLREYIQYSQRLNEEKSKQKVEEQKPQPKFQKQKSLFRHFIELLVAPFRR